MTNKPLGVALFLLLACATGFGQSTFQGLTPGKSTRVEVERVLGQPINNLSKTLVEYKSPGSVEKIYVQYRDEAPTAAVERIELFCGGVKGPNGCWELNEKLVRNTPQTKPMMEAFKVSGPDSSGLSKELTYFGAPAFVARTLIKDQSSVVVQDRVGLYSKELYENTLPKSCTGLFLGHWETNRGRLSISGTPDPTDNYPSNVKGSYSTNNGTIKGYSATAYQEGLYLEGEWKDDTGGGTMRLQIPDKISDLPSGVVEASSRQRNIFTGTWKRTSGKGPKSGTWEGRCVETN